MPQSLVTGYLKGSNAMVANVPYQPVLRRAGPLEVNYVDNAISNFGGNTTGTLGLIATIAQGASVNQRIGKRAYYKSLLIRGSVNAGSAGTIADACMMIVYDKRPTGALPAITDILTAINSSAFMNDNNTGRFEIIRRFDCVLLGNSLTPQTGKESENIDMFIKLKKRPIVFESAGTGQIGDIDEGALYCVTVGSQPAGSTAPIFQLAFRTRYTEN